MKITRISDFKRCVDGTVLREYLLDGPVSRDMVDYFGRFGRITINEKMRKPFFSFSRDGLFSIKGMVGDSGFYVRFVEERMAAISVPLLAEMIERYDGRQPGIEGDNQMEHRSLPRPAD